MVEYGGHCILPQKLFAIVVPEAVAPEMLRAEAGVGGWDEVFHPQAVHPFAGKLRFTEWESDTQEREEMVSNQGAGCMTSTITSNNAGMRYNIIKTACHEQPTLYTYRWVNSRSSHKYLPVIYGGLH